MSVKNKTKKQRPPGNNTGRLIAGISLAGLLIASAASAESTGLLQSSTDIAAMSEGYALNAADRNSPAQANRTLSTSQTRHVSYQRPQVWIGNIGTLLFDDSDGDGYHAGFSLSIDVNSDFGDTEVYAKIYLRKPGGELNLLHTTSNFTVYGDLSGDEYRVDTELRSNFEANQYDVIIDIHDGWNDALLDTANARGFSNLSALPLESAADQINVRPIDNDHNYDNDGANVVITEYAGQFGPLLFGLVGLLLVARRRLG